MLLGLNLFHLEILLIYRFLNKSNSNLIACKSSKTSARSSAVINELSHNISALSNAKSRFADLYLTCALRYF